jgi:hypothetical protein
MKIYIDSEYRCHTTNPDGIYTEVVTDVFNGYCNTFIEGYRFIPARENWTRSDGAVFYGEMIAPWKDYGELAAAQAQYERMMEEATTAYREGVDSV